MTAELDKARVELARALSELDFALKTTLPAAEYHLMSRRVGRLTRANSAYISALEGAKREKV